MQQIERTASIDDHGQIHLDQPLSIGKQENVRVIVFLAEAELPEDESDDSVIAGLRQSLQDFREGRTIPLANLWDGIDAD
jgi:hypothetical protein